MKSLADELQTVVDLSETEQFDLEHSATSAAVLAETQRQKMFEILSDEYPEASESFRELSLSWKDSSYSDDGQTLERIYDEAFDVDTSVRNSSLDGRQPRSREIDVAKVLKFLSEAYLTEYHGETARLFRGIGTHDGLCEAVTELLDAEDSGVELDLTVLSNFTSDRKTADCYGTLVVDATIEPPQVALAADFLLPVESEDGLSDHEAEIRVFGSPKIRVGGDELLLPESKRPLVDAIVNPESNDADDHDIVAGVVKVLAENSTELSLAASEKLTSWYDVFLEVSPFDAVALREEITAILHEDTDAP